MRIQTKQEEFLGDAAIHTKSRSYYDRYLL